MQKQKQKARQKISTHSSGKKKKNDCYRAALTLNALSKA